MTADFRTFGWDLKGEGFCILGEHPILGRYLHADQTTDGKRLERDVTVCGACAANLAKHLISFALEA